ncbi:MAG: metalloregulator ArsR/SmtB family transcription factor [Pseudomonadota bacterium]
MTSATDNLLACLRAAAEPTRLRLLAVLAEGEFTVSEITRIVSQSQPRVSRHLKIMLDAGLLIRFREQSWVFYRTAATGSGAELAQYLLTRLPPDDPEMAGDRERLAAIRAERAEQAADYLTEHADEWAKLRGMTVEDTAFGQSVLEAVGQRRLGDLLDIGTGEGRLLKLLAPRARSAVGLDISTTMLNVARTRLHAAGLAQVMVRHGDMYQVPYPDSSFDTVVVDQLLYKAESPAQVLAEAGRLLRPGGRVLIVDFAPFGAGFPTRGVPAQAMPPAGVRLGIGADALRRALQSAGFASPDVTRLTGRPLTVVLAVAQLSDAARSAA